MFVVYLYNYYLQVLESSRCFVTKMFVRPTLAMLDSIFFFVVESRRCEADSSCAWQVSDFGRTGVRKLWLEVVSKAA